jgi:glycosyltransferase involved in cell wall biosynthesis
VDEILVNSALLIAFHYPPVQVSSGLQRTLANSIYLPDYGWASLVLSAHPRAYQNASEGQLRDIPADTVVERAFALDTTRHLAIAGRYPGFLALPDPWVTWWIGGVFSGLRMIRKYRPKVLWSTYPIATAHLIGLVLHKITRLPWVADFRDSMSEPDYPPQPGKRRIFQWIERKVIANCDRAVFTTPGALRMYQARYPQYGDDKWLMIPNGYNNEIFEEVEATRKTHTTTSGDGPIILVHSGVIYPEERDPGPFFQAISTLIQSGKIDSDRVKIVLRACGHVNLFRPMLETFGIDHIVKIEPSIPYRDALTEILESDGLLVLQAANCNHQIPAKIYEYFRASKPILALTDPSGDTALALNDAGITSVVPLDDTDAICSALMEFIVAIETGVAQAASQKAVRESSREYATETLAGVFDVLTKN